MPSHEEGPSAGAISKIGRAGQDQNTSDTGVADGFRHALAIAGIDRVQLGIRDHGRLNWTPDPVPDEGPPEPDVAIARRRELARQRRHHLEQQLTLARRFLAEYGDAV